MDTMQAPTPDATNSAKSQLDALTQALIQRAGAATAGGMRQPTPQFSPQSMQQRPYDTHHEVNKRADIGQTLGNFGTFVHNMVAQHKQNQTRDAVAEWQGFNQSLEKAQVLAGDPSAPDYQQKVQKMLGDDPWVKANLDPSNPKSVKRLKNMYKALNVDLLEGDKDNVHRDGLKKFFQLQKAYDKIKQVQGQQQQQKQMDAQQKQQMMAQGLQKLMGQQTFQPPNVASMSEAARAGEERQRLDIEQKRLDMQLRDKYEFKQSSVGGDAGKWYAFDKTDPSKPAVSVRDSDNNPLSGAPKGKEGIAKVGDVPVGFFRNNRLLTPQDKEWTAQDAEHFKAAMTAYTTSEAAKDARVKKWEQGRINAYLASRMYPIMDAQGGTTYASGADIKANPGKYAPANNGERILRANAIVGPDGEIEATKSYLMDAIKNVGDSAFEPSTRAMIAYVLKSPDPASNYSSFLQSVAAAQLTDAQQDYVAALVAMQESALSLRTVAGMGQGSDKLRSAISAMLPSGSTPTQRYALHQISLFEVELQALRKGVGKVGTGASKTYGVGQVPD